MYFQHRVGQLATECGWRWVHFEPAFRAGRRVTPFKGDAGFPDTVLAKEFPGGCEILYWELKVHPNKPDKAQQEWLRLLGGECLYPEDWARIEKELTG